MKPFSPLKRYFAVGLLFCITAGQVYADSPQETYEQYLDAVSKASRLHEVFPFLTAERIQTIEDGLKKASEQGVDPMAIETFTLDLLKTGAKDKARFRELVIEDEASVVVERKEVTVEVLLVLEEGNWKIADERMLKIPNFN